MLIGTLARNLCHVPGSNSLNPFITTHYVAVLARLAAKSNAAIVGRSRPERKKKRRRGAGVNKEILPLAAGKIAVEILQHRGLVDVGTELDHRVGKTAYDVVQRIGRQLVEDADANLRRFG